MFEQKKRYTFECILIRSINYICSVGVHMWLILIVYQYLNISYQIRLLPCPIFLASA